MAEKNSIIEEALLDIKNIKTALNANTTEILRSVAREEIDNVVKESLSEIYEEEEVDSVNEESHKEHEESETPAEEKKEHAKGGSEKKEKSESKKMTEGMETEGMETEGMTYEEEINDLGASEELDMTSASDEDVIAIYKKLSGNDEIEIIGDEIHLSVSEPGEYVIKTNELGSAAPEMDSAMSSEMDAETPEMDDDSIDYEIELGGEEDEAGSSVPEDLVTVDDEESEEEEEEEEEQLDEKIGIGTSMSIGTHRNQSGPASIGAPENPKRLEESLAAKKIVSETTKKYNNLLVESNRLKSENEEFKQALKAFRKKLVETVVLNSNLSYVTRLFMENATTKNEKLNIIKRFDDEVTSLVESKKLYKTIANELASRKPLNESIEKKIIKEVSTSSSKQLNESTAYVDPSTKRILDLINRVEGKQQ
jgi:hypothetical protein